MNFVDANTSNTFCKPNDWQCLNYTSLPAPRSGHSAIVYTTFNVSWCELYNHKCVREKARDPVCKSKCSLSASNKKHLLAKQWEFIADNRRL